MEFLCGEEYVERVGSVGDQVINECGWVMVDIWQIMI